MLIPPLYHWSPRDRLAGIKRYGLVPGKRPTIGTVSTVHSHYAEDEPFHVVCFATDPWWAWRLSGDMSWAREVPAWDLWQTSVAEGDAVYILPEYGPSIREVRIANRVPKSRLRWVAERSAKVA